MIKHAKTVLSMLKALAKKKPELKEEILKATSFALGNRHLDRSCVVLAPEERLTSPEMNLRATQETPRWG